MRTPKGKWCIGKVHKQSDGKTKTWKNVFHNRLTDFCYFRRHLGSPGVAYIIVNFAIFHSFGRRFLDICSKIRLDIQLEYAQEILYLKNCRAHVSVQNLFSVSHRLQYFLYLYISFTKLDHIYIKK